MSLNGKIARENGGVDWLDVIPNPENSDYGYYDFYNSVKFTIQGYSTYALVESWNVPFPYTATTNYVLTSKSNLTDNEKVKFISSNHLEFVKNLKENEEADIWLIGGGKTNTFLLNNGLIDEIRIFMMPYILPSGIDLFEELPVESLLSLNTCISHSSGIVELIYKLPVEK